MHNSSKKKRPHVAKSNPVASVNKRIKRNGSVPQAQPFHHRMLAGKHLDHGVVAEGVVAVLCSFNNDSTSLKIRLDHIDFQLHSPSKPDGVDITFRGLWAKDLLVDGSLTEGSRIRLAFKEGKLQRERDTAGPPAICFAEGCEIWLQELEVPGEPEHDQCVSWKHFRTFKKARAEIREQQSLISSTAQAAQATSSKELIEPPEILSTQTATSSAFRPCSHDPVPALALSTEKIGDFPKVRSASVQTEDVALLHNCPSRVRNPFPFHPENPANYLFLSNSATRW